MKLVIIKKTPKNIGFKIFFIIIIYY